MLFGKPDVFKFMPSFGRLYTVSSLTPSTLSAINSHRSRRDKISEAINHRLFALATILALKKEPIPLSLGVQQQLKRGLIQYDPKLTPINLVALTRLHKRCAFDMDSIEKALLVKTLIDYGDQQAFRSGLNFLDRVSGGPIPMSALALLVEHAVDRKAPELCEPLWHYITDHYPLTLSEYTMPMVNLMRVFAGAAKYHPLAERVADACLINASNPSLALSIAKVAYKLGREDLIRALRAAPGFKLTREIEGVIIQLRAKLDKKLPASHTLEDLNARETAGVIKAVAQRNIDDAQSMLSQLSAPDVAEEGEPADAMKPAQDLQSPLTKQLLSQIELCNQHIENGSLDGFLETLSSIRKYRDIDGVLLNLRLKWELHHGTFRHAKRHYQNIQYVPLKQRLVALGTLSMMERSEADSLWLATERRKLENTGMQHYRPEKRKK